MNNNFFKEHPMITIFVGGIVAIIGNVIGGNLIGKGMGDLVEKTAREYCEAADLDYDECVKLK